MLNLSQGIRSVPVTLPLAMVLSFAISLASACSGRGSQASSTPAQSAEAPLQEPAEHGNGSTPAQPLLAVESSPPAPSRLHRAAGAGDVEQVKKLLDQGYEIDQKHARGLSALHEAVRRGHADVVAVFMEAGADPALVDRDGVTAVGVAVREGHIQIVKLLLDAGIKQMSHPIFVPSERYLVDGLYSAASNNNIEIMKILLESRKAWIKEKANTGGPIYRTEKDILDTENDTKNNTALHIAAYNGYTDIARLLVQAGADVMAQNRDHKTPIDLAHEQGHGSLAQMLEQTPELLEAAAAGDVEAVKRLIDEEQTINVKHPRDGYTPLHGAVRQGHADVVQVLLYAGADIYLQDKNKATALDIALEEGHAEIAEILGNADVPINLDTKSPLESAVFNRHTEMVKIITEHLRNL